METDCGVRMLLFPPHRFDLEIKVSVGSDAVGSLFTRGFTAACRCKMDGPIVFALVMLVL